MRGKILPLLLIGFTIFPMIVNKVESAELPIASSGAFSQLHYKVYAPEEVKIGETFSVIFEIYTPGFDLHIETVEVKVSGAVEYWEDSWKDMSIHVGATYQKTATFRAENEGLVYGYIVAVSNPIGAPEERFYGASDFYVTQIHSKTFDELESEYIALQKNSDTLEVDLNSNRSLMYIFVTTTIVFIVTTIYFARRKPKTT